MKNFLLSVSSANPLGPEVQALQLLTRVVPNFASVFFVALDWSRLSLYFAYLHFIGPERRYIPLPLQLWLAIIYRLGCLGYMSKLEQLFREIRSSDGIKKISKEFRNPRRWIQNTPPPKPSSLGTFQEDGKWIWVDAEITKRRKRKTDVEKTQFPCEANGFCALVPH